MLTPFHLAYHVTSLDEARAFYGGVLGCSEGRSTETWVDFDFFGHQISLWGPLSPTRIPGASATTWCRCRIWGWCCCCRTGGCWPTG